MSSPTSPQPNPEPAPAPHRWRPQYAGKHPRRFEEKHKEPHPERHADTVAKLLAENADEPHATVLVTALAGRHFATTKGLEAVKTTLPELGKEEQELSIRRVFQALRIAANDEFSALEMFLRQLPDCFNPGGRVAVLTFHSGEDRRVKKAFQAGLRVGEYTKIADEVIRPTLEERYANPQSIPAKLRWARRP